MRFASNLVREDQVAVVARVLAYPACRRRGDPVRELRTIGEWVLPQGVVLKAGEYVLLELDDRRRRPR